MKIAVLSDIHGNQYALEKVLSAAKKEKIEKLLILGDIVGYYYHPDKVLAQLKEWDFRLIKGNHEELLRSLISGKINESTISTKYGNGLNKAIERLSQEDIDFLINAPEMLNLKIDHINILMCHGSPWQSDYYLYPDTPQEVLAKCEISETDIVLTGHSHYSFIYNAGKSLLVGVGSVGQNRSMGGFASWAIINTTNCSVQLKSTPYDVNQLLAEIEKNDPELAYIKNILTRN